MSPTLDTNGDPVYLHCTLGSPPIVSNEPPKVLISGAGLAGLLLGNILEKAGIPYVILERAKEIKPLGRMSENQSKNLWPGIKKVQLNAPNSCFSLFPPAGAVMALSPSIQPALEQLGIFEDLMKESYPVLGIQFLNEDMSKIGE